MSRQLPWDSCAELDFESECIVLCDVNGRRGGLTEGIDSRLDAERRFIHSFSSFAAREKRDSSFRRSLTRIESVKRRSVGLASMILFFKGKR